MLDLIPTWCSLLSRASSIACAEETSSRPRILHSTCHCAVCVLLACPSRSYARTPTGLGAGFSGGCGGSFVILGCLHYWSRWKLAPAAAQC